jgi:hypothetical protein
MTCIISAQVLAYGQTGSGKTFTMGSETGSDNQAFNIIFDVDGNICNISALLLSRVSFLGSSRRSSLELVERPQYSVAPLTSLLQWCAILS